MSQESYRIQIASLYLLRQGGIRLSLAQVFHFIFENKNVALDWNLSSIFFLDKKTTLAMALGTGGRIQPWAKLYVALADSPFDLYNEIIF